MRSFDVIDCEQRTEAWFRARLGRLTGSVAAHVLAKGRGSEEAVGRRDLRIALALERLTGRPEEGGYVNADMQRGIDLEPMALAAYEALTGHLVTRTGFISHRELMAGCSLDGHIGDFEALVSFKCPKRATHWRYLRERAMPPDYVPQMLHELWVTGAREYHFVSFDDRFPDKLNTFLHVAKRDESAVQAYADKARAFLKEVETEYLALATLADLRPVLEAAV